MRGVLAQILMFPARDKEDNIDKVSVPVSAPSLLLMLSNSSAADVLVHILNTKLLRLVCRSSRASASLTTSKSFVRVRSCPLSFFFTVSSTGLSASMTSTRCPHNLLFCLTLVFASLQLLITAASAMMGFRDMRRHPRCSGLKPYKTAAFSS